MSDTATDTRAGEGIQTEPPILITENAATKVRELGQAEEVKEGSRLRIGVEGGGCSGFNYKVEFDPNRRDGDVEFEHRGIEMVIDPKSLSLLRGTQIDWESSLMGQGFTFTNPNASKTCGCGTSFNV